MLLELLEHSLPEEGTEVVRLDGRAERDGGGLVVERRGRKGGDGGGLARAGGREVGGAEDHLRGETKVRTKMSWVSAFVGKEGEEERQPNENEPCSSTLHPQDPGSPRGHLGTLCRRGR